MRSSHDSQAEEQAIGRLERVRWRGRPLCPRCTSDFVGHLSKGEGIPRWQCWSCNRAFTVLVGTIFEGTRTPLHRWFQCIALLRSSKTSPPIVEVARVLNIRPSVASVMMRKIRVAMLDPKQVALLRGVAGARARADAPREGKRGP
jgi:transposase-like protein